MGGPAELKKKGFDQPTRPNEQWHTDFSTSGYPVFLLLRLHPGRVQPQDPVWDLFQTMEGLNIEIPRDPGERAVPRCSRKDNP